MSSSSEPLVTGNTADPAAAQVSSEFNRHVRRHLKWPHRLAAAAAAGTFIFALVWTLVENPKYKSPLKSDFCAYNITSTTSEDVFDPDTNTTTTVTTNEYGYLAQNVETAHAVDVGLLAAFVPVPLMIVHGYLGFVNVKTYAYYLTKGINPYRWASHIGGDVLMLWVVAHLICLTNYMALLMLLAFAVIFSVAAWTMEQANSAYFRALAIKHFAEHPPSSGKKKGHRHLKVKKVVKNLKQQLRVIYKPLLMAALAFAVIAVVVLTYYIMKIDSFGAVVAWYMFAVPWLPLLPMLAVLVLLTIFYWGNTHEHTVVWREVLHILVYVGVAIVFTVLTVVGITTSDAPN